MFKFECDYTVLGKMNSLRVPCCYSEQQNILEYGNMILNHMNIFIKILRVIFFLPDITYLHMNKTLKHFQQNSFVFLHRPNTSSGN